MTATMFRRAVLAAALGLGVWAGLARADGPLPPTPAPSYVVVNGIIYTNTGVAAPAAPVMPAALRTPAAPVVADSPGGCPQCEQAVPGGPENPPKKTFWEKFGPTCCWTHFNNYTCGSTASEYAFIFGSCRNFFGEPCIKGPPEPAFPGEQKPRNICPNCARP